AWSDLPARKPTPVLYRWQDDLSVLTCQYDGFGLELRLHARPQSENSRPPDALVYLPLGPKDCALGAERTELMRQWKVREPVMSNDALVLTPAAGGPYDTLLVWFQRDHVVKIVARHSRGPGASLRTAEAGPAVAQAWGREARSFGWPLRQD